MRVSFVPVVTSAFFAAAFAIAACTGDDPAVVAPAAAQDGGGGEGGGGTGNGGQDGGGPAGGDGGSADGGTACAAPLADCDDDGTCETSLETSPEHCGACGHGCGTGGTCSKSACQPITLAKNLTGVVSVAVNATALVILKQGGPGVCPKEGCGGANPTSLETDEVVAAGPHGIYVDATNAYWLGRQTSDSIGNSFYLRKCAIAGCGLAPSNLDPDYQLGTELHGEGNTVFRYDPTGYGSKVYTDGSKAKEYLSSGVIAESLYFALAGGKLASSVGGGATGGVSGVYIGNFANTAPTRIMNAGVWVAIAAGNVYSSRAVDGTYDAIYYCAFAGCGGVGTNLGGTGPTAGTGKIADMTADASGVYWVENVGQVGRVMKCALPTCAGGPKALAVSQDKPFAIKTDESFVYWVNAGVTANTGAVMRVAK